MWVVEFIYPFRFSGLLVAHLSSLTVESGRILDSMDEIAKVILMGKEENTKKTYRSSFRVWSN